MAWLRRAGFGPYLSMVAVGIASLAGAMVFPLSRFGPWSSGSDPAWAVLLVGAWAALAGWAILYAALLRGYVRLSRERALYWAALCHLPLLLALGLVAAVHGGPSGWAYAFSPVGRQLFQPLARDFVIAVPLAGQALVLAACRWRALLRALPVLGLLLLSLGLRFSHAAWGLPALFHPDEHRYIGPATMMVARGDFNPHYFQNPSLMIYGTALLFWLLTEHSIAFHAMDQFFNLGIVDPRGDFFQMIVLRGVSAAAGTLTVAAVYLTGKELLGRRAGLFGAALLAVSFLHVRNSHYGTNDVAATCLLAFSVLFAARVYTRGRASDYLLAALFGGLATSTKYNAGVFVAALVAAHIARTLEKRSTTMRAHSYLLLLSPLVALAAFLAGTPYALLDSRSFLADFRGQFDYGAQPWLGQEPQSVATAFLAGLAQGFGVVPLGLAGLGALLAVREERGKLALLLSVPLVYYLFMSSQRLFFARFALPSLPFLALLAGYALDRIGATVGAGSRGGSRTALTGLPATRCGSRTAPTWRGAVPVLLLGVAVAQPLAFTLQHDALLGRTDTRWLAVEWIDANLPADATLAMDAYAQLDGKNRWTSLRVSDMWVYWPEQPDGLAQALSGRYRYVVASSFGYGPWQSPADPPSLLPANYRQLETHGHLLATFGPGRNGAELPYALDDMYSPFWNLWERERPGPTVRIYQMDPE